MRISKAILAAAAALTLFGPGALAAPQQLEGTIVKMDRAKHEITLKHWAAGGTVGATNAPTDLYKLENDPAFDVLKAGDQVGFTVDQIGGVGTVTQIQKK
jgi:Cu/Ag efflux protein CusF